MTNKEYIEKNNISFSEAMKMWDNKTSCINDWLNKEYRKWKFEVGDVIVCKDDVPFCWKDKFIFFVIDYDDNYLYVKEYNRKGDIGRWSFNPDKNNKYNDNHFIKHISYSDQDNFKKIF